jgi:hypothetical protein
MQKQETQKAQMSPKQLELVEDAIRMYKDSEATIRFEMDDEDSTIIVYVTDDGAQSFARFGIDGNLIGDWIW